MAGNEERIRQLLEGHLQGKLTGPEQTELFQAIVGDEPLFRRIAGDLYAGFAGSADALDPAGREAILSAIFAAGKSAGSPDAFRSKPTLLYALGSRWLKYAAAILVLLALGFALYYVLRPRMKAAPELVRTGSKADVPPGANKAMLTLGNGSRIILDSAANGMIASQGNAKISKVNNGLLAYNTNTSTEKPLDIFYNTLTTPRGGQFQLRLPDGTKVWLNAASSIRYPTAFAGKDRTVTVTGEAYFEVVHNSARPFHVRVNNMDIEDIGTHFNVMAYSNEAAIQTTLLEGKVRVTGGTAKATLEPGQQSVLDDKGRLEVVSGADLEEAVAWKNGLFEFNGNIQGIMRQIERWYDVEVVYEGEVAGKSFGGAISRGKNVSEVLKMLELTGSVHFKIEGRTITVIAGK